MERYRSPLAAPYEKKGAPSRPGGGPTKSTDTADTRRRAGAPRERARAGASYGDRIRLTPWTVALRHQSHHEANENERRTGRIRLEEGAGGPPSRAPGDGPPAPMTATSTRETRRVTANEPTDLSHLILRAAPSPTCRPSGLAPTTPRPRTGNAEPMRGGQRDGWPSSSTYEPAQRPRFDGRGPRTSVHAVVAILEPFAHRIRAAIAISAERGARARGRPEAADGLRVQGKHGSNRAARAGLGPSPTGAKGWSALEG